MDNEGRMYVHFSVDDIGICFRYLYKNKVKSLWDIPEFCVLHELNQEFGLCCSLYVFNLSDFFLLADKCPYVAKDFREASWLRIGYHGNKLPFKKDFAYVSDYNLFKFIAHKLEAHISSSIRLHNYYASPEQKEFLLCEGIDTLLYPDDNCFRYNEEDCFVDMGLLHRRTNVRIEYLSEITEKSLCCGKKHIEVFTHEQNLLPLKQTIRHLLAIYRDNNYAFL